MDTIIKIDQIKYKLDYSNFVDISIPLDFDGNQPNYFNVRNARIKPFINNNIICQVNKGGPCNVPEISLNIHCNGTHTESVGHLLKNVEKIGNKLYNILISTELITINPIPFNDTKETYHAKINNDELLITSTLINNKIKKNKVDALVIRTLPNNKFKKSTKYINGGYPFFTNNAMQFIYKLGIKHLLVDIPSIDRYNDDGILGNHRLFWGDGLNINSKLNFKSEKTITEFCYIPNKLKDGHYFINIQIPHFKTDSAPSRPIIIPYNIIH